MTQTGINSSVVSQRLSPYLAILETEITSDLRSSIKPEDLQAEVRKALLNEAIRQAAVALNDLSSTVTYLSGDEKRLIAAEAKTGRQLGYVLELLMARSSQRIDVDHQLAEATD